jgi:signal transduction histidine kinase
VGAWKVADIDLAARIRWGIALRSTLWFGSLILVIGLGIANTSILALLGTHLVIALGYALLPAAARTHRLPMISVLAADALLVTAIVHLLGTSVMPGATLYAVVVIGYAVLHLRWLGLAALVICLLLYAALLVAEANGVLLADPLIPADYPPFQRMSSAPGTWLLQVFLIATVLVWLTYIIRKITSVQHRQAQAIRATKAASEKTNRIRFDLEQAKKMEGLGVLAGRVAHDFNNLLTVIQGYVSEVVGRGGQPKQVQQDLLEVREAAARSKELVTRLLAFSRRQLFEPQSHDLNQIVGDFRPMLTAILGVDLKSSLRLCTQPLWVHADQGQIEQLLVALALNARDAMVAGGQASITTTLTSLSAARGGVPADLARGLYAELTFADDGRGMDKSVQERAFDPFFTTRPPGQGAGLGLSMAYGIARQNGGHIELDSQPGQGTRVRLLLPVVRAKGQAE